MTDRLDRRGKQDRSRVNLSQAHERRYWCKRFSCTERELVFAVLVARFFQQENSPDAVESELAARDLDLSVLRKRERSARKPRAKAKARGRK